jgi:hypothetical protein
MQGKHGKHSKDILKAGAFHTEEVGFRCVGVPPLGDGTRDGEALCKGSDDVAALDIVSWSLEDAPIACYLVILVCC